MREIKFKVWDNEKKRMSQPFNLGAFAIKWNDGDVEMPVLFATVKDGRFTYLQFTGKTDCKGVEIFDGDKIEFDIQEWGGNDNIHIVSWDDVNAEWDWGGGNTFDMDWRTVIGNIHEPL